jgi:hypothetical protein
MSLAYGFLAKSLRGQVWLPMVILVAAAILAILATMSSSRSPGCQIVFADLEVDRLEALIRQRADYCGRILLPRTIVERQHHFVLAQKVILFEMCEAERGPTGGAYR